MDIYDPDTGLVLGPLDPYDIAMLHVWRRKEAMAMKCQCFHDIDGRKHLCVSHTEREAQIRIKEAQIRAERAEAKVTESETCIGKSSTIQSRRVIVPNPDAREAELSLEEHAIMDRTPDGWYKSPWVTDPSLAEWHADWIKCRTAFIHTGSIEHRLAMEKFVTLTNPPLKPAVPAAKPSVPTSRKPKSKIQFCYYTVAVTAVASQIYMPMTNVPAWLIFSIAVIQSIAIIALGVLVQRTK
jgi:HEPN domain-containing protein